MPMPRILMASTLYWTSPIRVGAHHLARSFVDLGFQVAYVSDPISPFRSMKALTDDAASRLALYRSRGAHFHENRLWTYVPGALLPPANRFPRRSLWLHRHWWRFTWPNVQRVVKNHGYAKVDLLYLDNPRQWFWLSLIEAKRTVYRMADYNLGFHESSPAIATLEREICASVDTVIYTAEPLEKHVRSLGAKNAAYVPNGVNFQHFQTPMPQPIEYVSINGPIAVYVGSIAHWFNFGLIETIARKRPHLAIVLVGPAEHVPTRLRSLINVHVLGSRSYDDLPGYLQHADVGLIPFRTGPECSELVRCINPIKLYEYAAAGLPVVSSDWDELRRINSPARLARSDEEFIKHVDSVLARAPDKNELRSFARDMDWTLKCKQLLRVA